MTVRPTLASLRQRLFRRLSRPSFYLYLTAALMALGLLLGQRLSETAGMAQLAALANERLELYAATLEAELARHAYLPSLLAIDEEMLAVLRAPQDEGARRRASLALARINVRAGAQQIFIADADARVLASSDGQPVPARLHAAMEAGMPHFFAGDAAQHGTDFFLLQPVRQQGRRLGAIVVKLSLAPLEATWVDLGLRSQGEKLLVADDQDVVIMSSVPRWKYFVLGDVDAARRQALQASGRYPEAVLSSIGIHAGLLASSDSSLVQVPPLEDRARLGPVLLAQQRPLVPLGLRLVALSDPSEVWRQARNAGWSGAAFGACVGLLALYLASRRRALLQLFQAKSELQQAHGQLERVVDVRTAELRATNEELKRQIAQRLQAEDELVQAGKLAALGQMSAGISHEVNQPLTALRALARNSQLLLEAGRHATVAENLRTIDAMVERMGLITRQLKSFARKAELASAPVSLLQAIANARLLVEHRLRDEQVQISIEVPAGLRVDCEGNRLEQVLVNLFGNAIDAMRKEPLRALRISASPVAEGARVLVTVSDSGTGMNEALLPRLFEPFFTTKPAGEGLGLGLVISSKIIHEFGGTLRAANHERGMSFEFDLAVLTWNASEEIQHHV